MSSLDDLYGQLFGRSAMAQGSVIDMAEHGRVGGLSTGQSFKYTSLIDATTGLAPSFGGGTQYIIGSTGASLTGTLALWRDSANMVQAASTSLPFPVAIVSGAAGGIASGTTMPITNGFLENLNVTLGSRLASGSTLPITNIYLDVPLSTRLASGSTLPITNSFLSNIDTLLSTRLASGTTVPITGKVTTMGYYNPSLASYASGTTNSLSTDVNGNLNVTMNTQWTTAWFSASATNTIFKSTGGMLHLVTIEMQSSPTLSIYDNSSGVSGTLIVNLNANAPMGNYLQDIYVTGGISAKIHAGVAPSIKISYR